MSLAIPYPARRRTKAQSQPVLTPAAAAVAAVLAPAEPPVITPAEQPVELVWHVGLSHPGLFPHREASCPCAKAACGLVVPDPSVECPLHTMDARFLQVHSAADCDFPRTGWRRKRRNNPL